MRAVSLEVRAVSSRRDRQEFIELPFRLHSTSPQWVPPLRLERHMFHSRRMNAYFKHAAAQEFLAPRDGRVVGRISAQIDGAYDAQHGPGTGMFGFLELEDDEEVAGALIGAAQGWLAERGRRHMIGPMDYTMNDECRAARRGLPARADDQAALASGLLPAPRRGRRADEGDRPAHVGARHRRPREDPADHLRARRAVRDQARHEAAPHAPPRPSKEIKVFGEVYNTAWKRNWGFVPYSDADLKHYAEELQLVFDKHWFMLAEKDGETIGIAITVPDINQVLKKMNGRLLPFGWWHFLRRARIMDRVRVGFLGVKPEYQHTGTAARFYVEHFDMAKARPRNGARWAGSWRPTGR